MTIFEKVTEASLDPILGLTESYAADSRKNKVNLGVGIYKTTDLKPFILNTVKKAEALLVEKERSKDYLPIDGLSEYVQLTKTLVFGEKGDLSHIYGAQTVGGTAAHCAGGYFLKEIGLHTLYLSAPTWANHRRIFQQAGLEVHTYPYFSWQKRGFDFSAFIEALDQMEERSIVLLQVCCHNPTGFDPTFAQWKEIFDRVKKKRLFPFFDLAYQGFGDNLVQDVAPLTHFLQNQEACAIAVSHAKNFGIYSERCGALFIVCQDGAEAKRVGSRVKMIIRGLYSNPPLHGAHIVATILQDKELRGHWEQELATMRERITEMRKALAIGLQTKSSTSAFDFMATQKGMFSYTGLSEKQVGQLIADYGIYMPTDGRINVAGLNSENLEYVVDAILSV
jgi:aspartate aminotransferase